MQGYSSLLFRIHAMRILFGLFTVVIAGALLCGCELQRSMRASDAKTKMIGMSKEQVLFCMGPPKQKAHVGKTEVWAYSSTNGLKSSYGDYFRNATRYGANTVGNSATYGSSSRSFCTVNVAMVDDKVAAIHYNGPTGALLFADEQCAYAIEHCVTPD
jgi:hypothetical protein